MDDLTGQTFGGYELTELIGTGGMASIYRGFDKNLSRWVAIKLVPIQATGSVEKTILARFRLEAQAIAALRHRNILTIYGYGEEKGWAYIVMEYVPGGSLKDRIKPNQPMEWQRALPVVIAVAEALAFAHSRGVIHRDIKPANILMPQEDWPLLADFGLAKMMNTSGSSAPSLTMPGQVLGTMAYAAPEQIQESPIDTRVDIYSLGIVLYELLTGRLPFQGETAFDFLMVRLIEPPIPIQVANPAVHPVFIPIVSKALAQSPDGRYQTMSAFTQALIQAREALLRAGPPSEIVRTSEIKPDNEVIVRLKVTASGEEIESDGRGELIIGRGHKEVIPDIDLGPHGGSKAGVSRRHSRLVRRGNAWFVEDLNSTNGTFVNGTRIAPEQLVPVKNGDIVRCGQIELEFRVE